MWIFSAVANLLFGDGTVHGKLPLITFAAGSACVGVLVVIADALQHQLTKTSLLKLDYLRKNVFLLILIWGLGAAILAFLGAAITLINTNRIACITAGITWPALLPRVIAAAGSEKEKEEEQQAPRTEES